MSLDAKASIAAALLLLPMAISCAPTNVAVAASPRDIVDRSYAMFARTLESSCPGRRLTEQLGDSWRRLGQDVTIPLLVQELKRHVQSRAAMAVNATGPEMLQSGEALRAIHTGSLCTPMVAVMGLIDEWAARATGTSDRREASERFLNKIEDPARRRARGQSVDEWLELWFPLLYADARETLVYLTGQGA